MPAAPSDAAAEPPMTDMLPREMVAYRPASLANSILNGLGAALAAVALRYVIPLPPDLLPTATVVVAVSIATVFLGLVSGIVTMVAGGLLSWYLFFTPFSWEMSERAMISLFGFILISTVIISTAQLYRQSEAKRRNAEVRQAKVEAEQSELFAREMAHRLKNALAIVQSIAGQTFDHDAPQVVKFSGRLNALSRAHNLLSEHVKRPTASLHDVVHSAMGAFEDWADRYRFSGPEIELRDQQVVAVALALHELGTNAIKYGAFSNDAGTVDIRWSGVGQSFEIEWQEIGGPPVLPPRTKGFGTRLLSRTGMATELHFDPDGLRCVIRPN